MLHARSVRASTWLRATHGVQSARQRQSQSNLPAWNIDTNKNTNPAIYVIQIT
jgi:hypothetical protein